MSNTLSLPSLYLCLHSHDRIHQTHHPTFHFVRVQRSKVCSKRRVWGRGIIVLSSASSASGEYLIILGVRLSSTEDAYRAICVVYGSDQSYGVMTLLVNLGPISANVNFISKYSVLCTFPICRSPLSRDGKYTLLHRLYCC